MNRQRFGEMLDWAAMMQEEVDRMFHTFDPENSGNIIFQDLMCGLSAYSEGTLDDKLQICFKSFEVDEDRGIDKIDVLKMLNTQYSNMLIKGSFEKSAGAIAITHLQEMEIKDEKVPLVKFMQLANTWPLLREWFQVSTTSK